MALYKKVDTETGRVNKASGINFFCLPEGFVKCINPQINEVSNWPGVENFELDMKEGDKVNIITSSLNRYGHLIVRSDNRYKLDKMIDKYVESIARLIQIKI